MSTSRDDGWFEQAYREDVAEKDLARSEKARKSLIKKEKPEIINKFDGLIHA